MKFSLSRQISVAGLIALYLAGMTLTPVAAAEEHFGREKGRGYFTNQYKGGGSVVLPQVRNGLAIPMDIDTPDELIALLTSANRSGKAQERTGSAFIYYTMMGQNGGNYNRDISNDNWAQLASRVNSLESQGLIQWNVAISYDINTYWQTKTNSNGSYQPGGLDDNAWYAQSATIDGIRFFRPDKSIGYELKRYCANPLDDRGGLPEPDDTPVATNFPYCEPDQATKSDFTISGTGPTDARYFNKVSVRLGLDNTVIGYATGNYSRTLNQAQVDSIVDGEVHYLSAESDPYTSYYQPGYTATNPGPPPSEYYVNPVIKTNTYKVLKKIGPCYSYKLSVLTNDLQDQIQSGETVDVNGAVSNQGPTKSPTIDTRITRVIYGSGKTITPSLTSGRDSGQDVCGGAFDTDNRQSCDVVSQYNNVYQNGQNYNVPTYTYLVPPDISAGSTVCFVTSVNKPQSEAPRPAWRHSDMRCIKVSKRPKMQVTGGDVRIGGDINTGISLQRTNLSAPIKTYGSWVEYGALSSGPNKGFSSGSGLNGGSDIESQSGWSKLTFANQAGGATATGCSSSQAYGCFDYVSTANQIISQFRRNDTAGSISGAVSLSGRPSGTYTATNVTIDTSTIAPGMSIIINASGTVTINGDITYASGPYASVYNVPQVVIIAKNININDSVTNVDSWLLTSDGTTNRTGTINTCANITPPLTISQCNQRLIVNGPVITSDLKLQRTAGADSAVEAALPSEIFNLRADSIIWARLYSIQNGKALTVYTIELPPRF